MNIKQIAKKLLKQAREGKTTEVSVGIVSDRKNPLEAFEILVDQIEKRMKEDLDLKEKEVKGSKTGWLYELTKKAA